jgi:hypothetical protein
MRMVKGRKRTWAKRAQMSTKNKRNESQKRPSLMSSMLELEDEESQDEPDSMEEK